MNNTIISDFVTAFFPVHKKYWDELTEEEKTFLNIMPYDIRTLKRVIFKPEENAKELEKFRKKVKDLELILSHRECVFDYCLFENLYHFTGGVFNSNYDFIFMEPEKYAAQIKEVKTINGYMKKIYDVLPSYYRDYAKQKSAGHEEDRRNKIFGKFYQHLDSVTFQSNYDYIEFKRSQMNLIPYFIEYRNSHLIDWVCTRYVDRMNTIPDNDLPFYEFSGLDSRVRIIQKDLEEYAQNEIRSILAKYNYSDVTIEKFGGNLLVRYQAKNSLFNSHCTRTVSITNLNEELEKFESCLGA